ncbi:hypothetical protein EV421DRAFT_1915732 [Armillaria borealis]|uniref:Heterokaryon incompatibility domain-containing protein n=1 Tax=Armillaria borealis TaxID=47425 RepID=A0AA39IDT1_9AGAR|nr:hypothetical protein EV421DRAFT_1915732 [Armillaria borealis]
MDSEVLLNRFSKLQKRRWQWKKKFVFIFKSLRDFFLHSYEGMTQPPIYPNLPNLPQSTLSALAETGQEELTIPVLKQRSYSGDEPVISSALSDTPCIDLGVDGVLEKLNETLGTSYTLGSYTLGSKILHFLGIVQLHSILEPVFGIIMISAPSNDHQAECAPMIPLAISHVWVDGKDRMNVMTPINGYEWPVPMLRDANLDLIRIEMLNHGARYAWLDVLCLWQEGGKDEHLRMDEWKSDVPTIGYMYVFPARVEITDDAIVGGEIEDNIMEKEVQRRFDLQLASLREIQRLSLTFDILSEMQDQVSTKPLDKVAGLAYPLQTESIPIYDAEQSDADAWEALMDVMSSTRQAELLFHYPEPGNGKKCWQPSWEQVTTRKTISHFHWHGGHVEVDRMEDRNADRYKGFRIDSGYVQGLSEARKELKCRQGELVLKDVIGIPYTVKILADHAYPIPNGFYTLICGLYTLIHH